MVYDMIFIANIRITKMKHKVNAVKPANALLQLFLLLNCWYMPVLAFNKRGTFDYELQDKFEAGLVLSGSEVKSVKNGHISLKGSFVTMHDNELYLTNANISPYPFSKASLAYDPNRSRKLLVRKSEIKSLIGKLQVKGLTLVPLRVYTKKRLIKLEFALARGKKAYDKRKDIAQKESKRNIDRTLKNS